MPRRQQSSTLFPYTTLFRSPGAPTTRAKRRIADGPVPPDPARRRPPGPAGRPAPGRRASPNLRESGLLDLALTHRSYSYENDGVAHNERLEFLGDAVLQLAVTEQLYTAHPSLPEGDLARRRAGTVSSRALAVIT